MFAVIYNPSGEIVQSTAGSVEAIEATAAAMELNYIEVAELRDDYDRTHVVQNGELVQRS